MLTNDAPLAALARMPSMALDDPAMEAWNRPPKAERAAAMVAPRDGTSPGLTGMRTGGCPCSARPVGGGVGPWPLTVDPTSI